MSQSKQGRGYTWTIPELERAYELVVRVGLPTGSAAKLLSYEFGKPRTASAIRTQLRLGFDWHGKPHGDPSALKRSPNT